MRSYLYEQHLRLKAHELTEKDVDVTLLAVQ